MARKKKKTDVSRCIQPGDLVYMQMANSLWESSDENDFATVGFLNAKSLLFVVATSCEPNQHLFYYVLAGDKLGWVWSNNVVRI